MFDQSTHLGIAPEGFNFYVVDLHIHIGRTAANRPVKITAARDLTFENIAIECANRKGIDVVAIIDCASPGVISDIRKLMDSGEMVEQPGGGLRYRGRTTLLLAAEMEVGETEGGTSHHICFFRNFDQIRAFSDTLSQFVTNLDLSSQRCRGMSAQDLWRLTDSLGGFLIPAHAFTPHKSVYGNCVARLSEMFDPQALERIPAVELGLSADTYLADRIAELNTKAFVSNSDAHSLPKIGREYNIFQLQSATFDEVLLALKGQEGRRIVANYGMDPKLGKYHRTYCLTCDHVEESPPPIFSCPLCGGAKVIRGVLDRIVEIQDYDEPHSPPDRPPYYYQIPLQFVPKVGTVTLNKLLNRFETEMAVLHQAPQEDIAQVVGQEISENILAAREGRMKLQAGGGGKYGKAIGSEKASQMNLFG